MGGWVGGCEGGVSFFFFVRRAFVVRHFVARHLNGRATVVCLHVERDIFLEAVRELCVDSF